MQDTTPAPPATRSWTDPLTGSEYTVRECYRDANGHQWWEFEEPLRMPTARGVEGEFAAEWAKLHLTPDDLLAYIADMKAKYDKGLVGDMYVVLDNLHARAKAMADKRSLQELAKVYFLIDDEPIGWPTAEHTARKEKAWAEDPAAQGFFLRTAFVYTHGYSEVSGIDILTYLRAIEMLRYQTPAVLNAPSSEPSDSEKPTDGSTRGRSFLDNVRRSTRKRTS